jgi:hypothetical protein
MKPPPAPITSPSTAVISSFVGVGVLVGVFVGCGLGELVGVLEGGASFTVPLVLAVLFTNEPVPLGILDHDRSSFDES